MSDRETNDMPSPLDSVAPDDILLTAYIDGELDASARTALDLRLKNEPALAERLERLTGATGGLEVAFAALLGAAPLPRLTGILGRVGTASQRQPAWGNVRRAVLALAAAIVIFALGGVAGRFLPAGPAGGHDELNWRQAVAEYQQYTTTDTLAAIPDAPDVINAELKTISGKLNVALTPDKLALAGATLKRADLFSFAGRPLVQLAYLTEGQGPVAFCIIPSNKPDAATQFEVRDGFNVVFWNDDGRAYLLIGQADRATLEHFAATLSARV